MLDGGIANAAERDKGTSSETCANRCQRIKMSCKDNTLLTAGEAQRNLRQEKHLLTKSRMGRHFITAPLAPICNRRAKQLIDTPITNRREQECPERKVFPLLKVAFVN